MSVQPDADRPAGLEVPVAARPGTAGAPGLVAPLDMRTDAHVHTAFAAGRDSVGMIVTAAERAGLRQVVFADQAAAGTGWLRAYQDAVRRAQQRTELTLRVGIEVEVVRPDGWLDFPTDLAGLERVSDTAAHLPLPGGPAGPRQLRGLLRAGRLRREEVAEALVGATVRALERASRYAPTQLARPLSLLTRLGHGADDLPDDLIEALIAGCRGTGTAVEISEAWRVPTLGLATRLAEAGVNLVPASDAGDAAQVGRWQYLRSVEAVLAAPN